MTGLVVKDFNLVSQHKSNINVFVNTFFHIFLPLLGH